MQLYRFRLGIGDDSGGFRDDSFCSGFLELRGTNWCLHLTSKFQEGRTKSCRLLSCLLLVGADIACMESTLFRWVWMPSAMTKCPKYSKDFLPNWHLSGLSFRLAAHNLLKTSRRFTKCSSKFFPKTMMSLRYAKHYGSMSGPIMSISRWKVADALCRPNGITVSWNNPLEGSVKEVTCLLSVGRGLPISLF